MKSRRLTKGMIVWISVSSALIALLLAVTLILTCNSFVYNTFNSIFGDERFTLVSGNPDDYIYYTADYKTKEDALAAANSFNERICEEGFVLLENKNDALPLAKGSKVTVFGNNSVDLVIGGSGSNAGR